MPVGRSYRQVLSTPHVGSLLAAYAVSYLGDAMSGVTVAWLAIELAGADHSSARSLLVGAAVAAYALPGVIGGFALARWLRRRPSRLLVVVDAVLRAVLLGAIAGLRAAHALEPVTYVALLAASSVLLAWGLAGRYTVLAELVGPERTVAANALQTALISATFVLGPAIAGVVVGDWGAGPLIGLDALSYLVLAAVVWAVVPVRPAVGAQPSPTSETTETIESSERAVGGVRLLRRHGLIGVIALTWWFNFLYGPVEVALPLYVSSGLHRGAGVLGLFWTLFGAGAAIGSLASGWLTRLPVWPVCLVIVAGWGLCLLPFGFSAPLALTLIAFGVGGLIYGPFIPLTYGLIQRRVPTIEHATVLAARGALMTTASPLGTALGGPLAAGFGPARTLAGSGLATVAAAVLVATVGGVGIVAPIRSKWRHAPPQPTPE